jgi:hypothetical protein
MHALLGGRGFTQLRDELLLLLALVVLPTGLPAGAVLAYIYIVVQLYTP